MAVALLTACDGDSTGNGGSIVGTYTLQTINGDTLPFVRVTLHPPGTFVTEELTAVSFRLNSGNICSVSLTISTHVADLTPGGNVTVTTSIDTQTATCTYSVTGTTIQLNFPGDMPPFRGPFTFIRGPLTGSISGNTITFVDEDGDTFVLTK